MTLADILSSGGGVHRHIRDLAFGLAASGKVEVHIVYPSSTDEEGNIESIYLHPLKVQETRVATPSRLVTYLQLFRRLPTFFNGLNEMYRFDLVHCHHNSLHISRTVEVAWVNTVHGLNTGEYKTIEAGWRHLQPQDLLWWLYYRALTPKERTWITGATLNIAVSEAVKEELIQNYGASRSSIRVVYNGVDVTALNDPRWRKFGDPKPDQIKVLSVVSPKLRKGTHYLLRGLAEVPESIRIHLFLAGTDRSMDANFARKLGLTDRVSFLGWVPYIEPYYHLADFVVVPSLYEPFPYFCLDALACGKPVIAARMGGLREIVINGFNGLLYSPRDPAELAEKMIFLAQNESERKRMGQKGKALVSSHFTLRDMIDNVLKVYDDALDYVDHAPPDDVYARPLLNPADKW